MKSDQAEGAAPYSQKDQEPMSESSITSQQVRPCPDGAALVIKGEHFPCDQMRHMHPDSASHQGWAHGNSDAEAIWESSADEDAIRADERRRVARPAATPTLRRLETISSAAERHGVHPRTIRRRIADGTITGYRSGPRLVRVDPSEVDAALLSPIPHKGSE